MKHLVTLKQGSSLISLCSCIGHKLYAFWCHTCWRINNKNYLFSLSKHRDNATLSVWFGFPNTVSGDKIIVLDYLTLQKITLSLVSDFKFCL